MGRPVGAKNKRTLEVEQILLRFDVNPFEVLMMMAAGDWSGLGYKSANRIIIGAEGNEVEIENIPITVRCQAAKEAVQYIYSKKRSLEVEITTEQALKVLENEFKDGPLPALAESLEEETD